MSITTLLAFELIAYIIIMCLLWLFFPYQTAKKHGFIIVSLAMFLVYIYTIEKGAHFEELDSWVSIADNILSGSIFSILCVFFWKIEYRIKNKHEDSQKLSQNYNGLAKRYEKCNLVKVEDKDGKSFSYPIIEVGLGDVTICGDNLDNIIINDSKDIKYQLPRLVENNYSAIFTVHDTSTTYNNINIRVKDMLIDDEGKLHLITERTTYYDSLVTNRVADYQFAKGLSVREIFEPGPRMNSLQMSELSNHLGFNGFVESADGYFVFIKRSGRMTIAKRTYGNSIGASLKTKFALNEKGEFTPAGLMKAIYGELQDELKIKKNLVDENSVRIIALYRDCVECGKPQFLFYAKSTCTAYEISRLFKGEGLTQDDKLSDREKDWNKTVKDGNRLVWISRDVLKDHIVFYENGVEIDPSYTIKDNDIVYPALFSDKMKSRKTRGWRMKMVPSAAASVYFLKKTVLKDS